ncbi:hypothetical protein [Mycolicibacterium austroafricanum]|uniref:hypothetical protein n=1 Tax=Mycolicibacterium austroafricanum TaxID=39687 RepID=UPI001CA379D0|nr:hypothetical protein [Mycolicibacterium austroafricanum]QZT56350.1 hypothetical protein JN084_26110 [Mycolicibacterium austroafricanum]
MTDYEDPSWRQSYADFCDLMELLGDCTIADGYVVSDDLNNALRLSDQGKTIQDRLVRQHDVNAKDARLMCALTIGHDDIFVDIEGMDVERVAAAIDQGITRKQIRFPFIYGRNLYDAYAELFEEEQEFLDNAETLQLLDRLPIGVFQYGRFTVGPYGLRISDESRRIPASRRVPAYHCSKPSCDAIHPVSLQTGFNAPINKERDKLRAVLESLSEKSSEWWAFAAELHGGSRNIYGDQNVTVLMPLLGDSLSDLELRVLVAELLDGTQGRLREAVSSFLTVGNAQELVAQMNREHLLQISLLVDEDCLATTLDRLVRSGDIFVPKGDVRRPVMNRAARSGAFQLRAELGHFGVRCISDNPGLPLLRERRLLNKLYMRDSEADLQELEWQLRGIDLEDLDEKLEHFFQRKSPSEALRRLVLARQSNMITACHEVRIDLDREMTDEEIIDTLLWKLGFEVDTGEDPHASFWRNHEKMSALTQSAAIGSSERMVNSEPFREAAGRYFPDLEGLLSDSLAFTSWALLADHSSKSARFSYDSEQDRQEGLALLQSARFSAAGGDRESVDYTSDNVALRSLMLGFGTLASHLEACRASPELYERPRSEIPDYDGKTDLKRFLLRSKLPFLNLSHPSQERILEGLKSISQTLESAEVNIVRNDYLHFRRTPLNIAKVEKAVEAIHSAVTKIENLGFCRLLFEPTSIIEDRWGQTRHEFAGPRSFEHCFTRPTTLDWMGLPSLTEPQYLLRAASFEDPNEVLRFTRRFKSEFSEMWLGYPSRRRRGPGLPAAEEQPTEQSEIESTK